MLQGVAVTSAHEGEAQGLHDPQGDQAGVPPTPGAHRGFRDSQGRAGREPLSQPWALTKFTEEPKEAWWALAEGAVGPQAPATIAAFTDAGGSCHGGRGQRPQCGGTLLTTVP